MKIKPVPTSPKAQKRDNLVQEIFSSSNTPFERPKQRSSSSMTIIILVILVGFLAGLFGNAIFTYLSITFPNLPIINKFYFRQNTNEPTVVVTKNEKNQVGKLAISAETFNKTRQMVVSIFLKKTTPNNNDLLSQNYLTKESLGNGIILSEDGLIMTSRQVISDLNKEYVLITSDQKVFSIANIISDPATDFLFFRIKIQGLLAAQFVDPQDLQMGTELFSIKNNPDGSVETNFVKLNNLHYISNQDSLQLIFSSEILPELYQINSSLTQEFIGAPLFTVDGKIIGLSYQNKESTKENNLILSSKSITSIIPQILKRGIIERIYLGINYLDLSRINNFPDNTNIDLKKGALIYNDPNLDLPAVKKLSPAAKVKLQDGDIIIKINQTEIDFNNSLTQIIQSLNVGDNIEIIYLRNNVEQKVNVVLEALIIS